MNTPNPLYIIINKIIGYIKESNRNKYLTIVFTDEIKDTLKKKEELCYLIMMKNILKSNLIQMMIYL